MNPSTFSQTYECTFSQVGGEWCFIPYNTIIEQIKKEVSKYSTPKQAQLKTSFQGFYPKHLSSQPLEFQLHIAYQILRNNANFKIIAILIILKNIDRINERHLEDIGTILDKFQLDHALVECIATKLLYELIVKKPAVFLAPLMNWRNKNTQFGRMRACCATFTRLKKENKGDQIWDVCDVCVRNPERFVQLGVGCSMKDLCSVDEERVIDFVRKHIQFLSRDGFKYSIEKIKDASVKKELLGLSRNKVDFVGASAKQSEEEFISS
ncbi:hypothetical protein EIN_327850 [Entamoeba invadens IP1]|uniref:Uncharacterized protein n=1 Tax=Entamoeba invadens IP1 TaxID=370355 RepID=A0A0A1U0R5_ENTIV|nr:hypothetical protein EIN_327850 [Entamoeba invadens IP1]ELP86128.1 hypothetical protein EIN_327850 [Entamoeba invadens IP1]|eukprot:XP_004185474.1 hypothetical protein EIN_327850 [Entamoeba invadens IP1]